MTGTARSLTLPLLFALVGHLPVLADDGPPTRVLVDELRERSDSNSGKDEGEGPYYLWLSINRLARERAAWRFGEDAARDTTLGWLEVLEELWQQDQEGSGAFIVSIQPGAAASHGLRDGQLVPADTHAEICNAAGINPPDSVLPNPPSSTFDRHAQEARGALLGRVREIHHGLHAIEPALLLDLDVEEALFPSDHSQHPFVVVTTGGYVHDGTVYCSTRYMAGWQPSVGDRLIFMPVSGPWDKNGKIMLVLDPGEVFLVEEPDRSGVSNVTPLDSGRTSVPATLVDFRRRLLSVRAGIRAAPEPEPEAGPENDVRR